MIANTWIEGVFERVTENKAHIHKHMFELLDGLNEGNFGDSFDNFEVAPDKSIRVDDYGDGECEVFVKFGGELYFYWVLSYEEMSFEDFHNIVSKYSGKKNLITNPQLYKKLRHMDTGDKYKAII